MDWSGLRCAVGDAAAPAAAALAELGEACWYPRYAFVRCSGHDVEAAGDLTQACFELLPRQL